MSKRQPRKITSPKIEIVCEVFGSKVTAKQAAVFERAIRQAAAEAFPRAKIRGLWVHQGIKVRVERDGS